jgi:riboflavin synthase
MFTGIITGVGRIDAIHALGSSLSHGKQLSVVCPPGYLDDVNLGDSIAINGACMTATALDTANNVFRVDVSAESLARTAGLAEVGPVNLEKALRAQDRLGGHIVSGHVDGVGAVAQFSQVGESWLLQVQVPAELAKFLAYKGSITVNGVSLTVNQVQDLPRSADGSAGQCLVSINLIPHTVQHTALGVLKTGSLVNLEIDLIARYVERMLQKDPA